MSIKSFLYVTETPVAPPPYRAPKPATPKRSLAVVSPREKLAINAYIFGALSKGYAVLFQSRATGVQKVVNAYAPRGDGELKAVISTGKSDYVNPFLADYDISTVSL